jgi:thymidine kinase
MAKSGYVELAIGPMFACKSSWLIGHYKQYKVYTDNIIVINFKGDDRYSSTELSTHDKIMIPCIHTNKLYDLTISDETEVILINEGQFFPDIVEWVKYMVDEKGIRIYICGLDGDYKREKFGTLLDLIPFCDKITKLTAICGNCKNGNRAIFTLRKTESDQQVLIGEKEHYLPVCRKCYIIY